LGDEVPRTVYEAMKWKTPEASKNCPIIRGVLKHPILSMVMFILRVADSG